MSLTILNVLLWLPFLLFAAIYSAIFCVRGYQKGLYRSLISVGATVVACVVSLLLSNVFSSMLVKPILSVLPVEQIAGETAFADVILLFVKGVLQNVIALMLFSLLLFILSIVFKAIASSIKKNKLLPENNGMKWAGMAVRLVEALALSLLLLIPLYGSFAAYVPAAEKVMSTDIVSKNNEFNEVAGYLKEISKHPLVKVSGSAPVAAIYNNLSEVKTDDSSLNIPEMVSVVEEVINRVGLMENMTEAERTETIKELVVYLRDNVVNQKWYYSMYCTIKNELINTVNSNSAAIEGMEKEFLDGIIKSVDFSEEELKDISYELLNFTEYFLENNYLEKLEGNEVAILYTDDFLARFGKLLNCSEATVSIKRLVVLVCLEPMFDDSNSALAFLEKQPITLKTDVESQKKEAGAMLVLMKGVKKLIVAEALVRHPDFGFDSVKELISARDFAALLFGGEIDGSDPVLKYLNDNPELVQSLMDKLKACENAPLTSDYFDEYASDLILSKATELGLGYFGSGMASSLPEGVIVDKNVVSGDGFSYYVGEGGSVSGFVVNGSMFG